MKYLIEKYLGEAKEVLPKTTKDKTVELKKGKYTLTIYTRAGQSDPGWMEAILNKGSVHVAGASSKFYPNTQVFEFDEAKVKGLDAAWKYIEKMYKSYPDKPPKRHPGAGPSLRDIEKAVGTDYFRKNIFKDIGD